MHYIIQSLLDYGTVLSTRVVFVVCNYLFRFISSQYHSVKMGWQYECPRSVIVKLRCRNMFLLLI